MIMGGVNTQEYLSVPEGSSYRNEVQRPLIRFPEHEEKIMQGFQMGRRPGHGDMGAGS